MSRNMFFLIVLLLLTNSVHGGYLEAEYLTDKNNYPATLQADLNKNFTLSDNAISIAPGAQVKLKILIAPGLNFVKFVPLSNTFQYGVKLGDSPNNVSTSNGDSFMIYSSQEKSSEHYAYVYIDNSNSSRSFTLHPKTSLTIKAIADTEIYDAWYSNSLSHDSTDNNDDNYDNYSDDTQTFSAISDLYHLIGREESGGWAAATDLARAGYLSYGPYISTLANGKRNANFTLMIDNNIADNHPVARIEVYNFATNKILAKKEIYRKDFLTPLTYQVFSLSYDLPDKQHVIEYRTVWYGTSYLKLLNVVDFLVPTECQKFNVIHSQCNKYTNSNNIPVNVNDIKTYNALTDLYHQLGWKASQAWVAGTQVSTIGYLAYGPYVKSLPVGNRIAGFNLFIDNNNASDDRVADIEVFDFKSGKILAKKEIKRTDFINPMSYQSFKLPYTITNDSSIVEYRALWYGTSYLSLKNVLDASY